MKLTTTASLSCALLLSVNVLAHTQDSSRPDAHAPISVMGEHTHKAGEFMFSYRHMQMDMDDLVDGDRTISANDLLGSSHYMMAPTKMTMKMDMLGAMYAPTNSTTLMAMLPYTEKSMDMVMMMHGSMGGHSMLMQSTMKSSGFGDLKLGALHNFYTSHRQNMHLNLMISLPTGSIDKKNSQGQALAYGMQLGSGTYDLLTGVTYTSQYDHFSWGAQATATIRLGENDRDYTLGDRYQAQAWIQKLLHQHVSISSRVSYENWRNIDGEDKRLDSTMSPLADPNSQGGNQLIASVGINTTLPAGNRLSFEYNKQIERDLDGPQMAFDDSFVVGWQLSFK